jgi:hypothetical protein
MYFSSAISFRLSIVSIAIPSAGFPLIKRIFFTFFFFFFAVLFYSSSFLPSSYPVVVSANSASMVLVAWSPFTYIIFSFSNCKSYSSIVFLLSNGPLLVSSYFFVKSTLFFLFKELDFRFSLFLLFFILLIELYSIVYWCEKLCILDLTRSFLDIPQPELDGVFTELEFSEVELSFDFTYSSFYFSYDTAFFDSRYFY